MRLRFPMPDGALPLYVQCDAQAENDTGGEWLVTEARATTAVAPIWGERMITGRHVVIDEDSRWQAQVWEHDGDEPIALFRTAGDAHLFNAALEMIAKARAALAKAGVTT